MIPARMKSTRLPNKPLKLIEDLPMIVHVYRRAKLCPLLCDVYVVTDSEEIKQTVEQYGGKAILTIKEHKTGTDRIGEAVENIDCDIVVNVQGDEPLVNPDHITAGIKALQNDPNAFVSCLCTETQQFNNVDEVKLVLNKDNDMLYLSRSDIPSTLRLPHSSLLKQYCIYAFKKQNLLTFINWEQTTLEKIESIELLRVIENNHKLKGVLIPNANIQSVDTEEDLNRVRELMKSDQLKNQYLKNE